MAFKSGRITTVWFDGLDVSPYLNSAEMSIDVETADTTTFGVTGGYKTAIAGNAGATFSFGGLYDPAITQLGDALAVDAGVLTYCPAGALTVGDRARMAAITSTSYVQSSPVGDAIAISWDAMAEGSVTFGDVIHILSEDTNTTTGAAHDQTGASTATGWTAQAHVIAVDAGGGSWVFTVQDSADGTTDWTTIATFAAKTAAGAQHLVSAAATTAVRRYIRYVATRTGGSAGEGVTFALAFARSL